MTNADIPLDELRAVAMDAAYVAGRRALAYFNTRIEVQRKADNTPVTRADRESEELIRQIVSKRYPSHAILGEEQGATPGDEAYRWIIDPIDGTKTFITGAPLWGVLIGVEVRGRPSVGVIYLPVLDEMVSAATGMGCTWNGRPAHVSEVDQLSEATLLTSSIISCQKRSNVFDTLASKCRLVRNWGDCYGYALVATGRAEIMVDPAMNPWDSAPMLPILEEAGGHFTNWAGEPTIWTKDAVATNGKLFEQVRQITSAEPGK
ncbi:MAG TPA: histidinol-phosphatase [Tepidisphaeraceae bacterium]|nr:histidinol-phosphatase [Tepidisphaeraceae bacterium]